MGAVFAFPRLSGDRLDDLLPRFLDDADAVEASCWSRLPTEPRDLGETLLAAGFRDGWQARWMAVELLSAADDVPAPPGVRIEVVESGWIQADVPYDGPGLTALRERLTGGRPQRVWHVAARRGSRAVGHAMLNVTTGYLGVAGVYDMGVAPDERRRGIGSALVRAVLALGRAAGCEVATLNATPDGERLYATLGFRLVGVAQTWWR
jgi:GNAT superfamily N-acetyltransferase